MIVPALFGAGAGIGLWLVITAVRPRPAPLANVLAALWEPPRGAEADIDRRSGRLVSWLSSWLATTGVRTSERDRQLALTGITPEAWARDKLVGAVGGLVVPLLVWAGLAASGIVLPPFMGVLALLGAIAGWLLPDLSLRDQVARRRKAFTYALSAYLDLVNVIMAGGGGTETALVAAADAGDGWAFRELRQALGYARTVNEPLWTAFDRLGRRLGISELRDLASSIQLAGAQGARIRASLAVKSDTLRAHQVSQTEQEAEATTERMNVPTAVLLLGFLMFVVFPAVGAISGFDSGSCTTDSLAATPVTACPQPTDQRSDR